MRDELCKLQEIIPMMITIIEKEILLVSDIVKKLKKLGYEIEFFDCVAKAIKYNNGDIYLLSTVFSLRDIENFIKEFHYKSILLLVNYKSNKTLNDLIALGAKDYIMKPVSIDILVNRIEHYIKFEEFKFGYALHKEYHEYIFKKNNLKQYIDKICFPIIIITNHIASIDLLILEYGKIKNIDIVFIRLNSRDWENKIYSIDKKNPLYLSGLEVLKEKEKNKLFKILKDRKFIISSFTSTNQPYQTIEIITQSVTLRSNEILSIVDYSLMVIQALQYKFPDIQIAKKLGYSRKKVLDLRKKINLF